MWGVFLGEILGGGIFFGGKEGKILWVEILVFMGRGS